MYAIIRTGGKQAKVEEGDVLDIERIKASDEVSFTPLLVVTDDGTVVSDRKQLGDAKVVAEVLGERRGEKIDIFKYKNKTGYRRHQGHRQTYTTIQVTKIEAPGSKKSKKKDDSDKEESKAKTSQKAAKKPAKKTDKKVGDEKAAKKDDAKKDSGKKSAKKADEEA
jgi:large subunit ribosomal protein L21